MIIKVKIIPNASKDEIVELNDDLLKIKISSPPIDGKANKKLIDFLSNHFKINKSSIRILKGLKSKIKEIEINNLDKLELNESKLL